MQITEFNKSTFEAIRQELAEQITRAQDQKDYRRVVILCRKFTDAFPYQKSPIERHVKEVFLQKLREAKTALKSTCPVCKGPMENTLCADDDIRPFCKKCGKTYTPMGYDDSEEYALKWYATEWNGTETGEVITLHTCIHDMSRCGKIAVMFTKGFYTDAYYCADHIPVGFNGVIPEELKL